MQSTLKIILLLFAVCFNWLRAQSSIDTTEPIVRLAPNGLDNDSYFGYTVLLHRTQVPTPSSFSSHLQGTRIIVSAPNGTAPGGTAVDNTGLLYLCPITQGDCVPLNGTNNGLDRKLYDRDANGNDELKMGQFLGVAMDSKDNQFIVCAHRHIFRGSSGTSRLVRGKCYYTANRDLQGFMQFDPCNGLSTGTGQFGYCQAGTSVALAEETSGGNIAFAVGAPGSYSWSGVLFRRSSSGIVDRMSQNEGTGSNDWQGYSLTKGHIVDKNREDFVVSVPRRGNYIGAVNIVSNDRNLDIINVQLQGVQVGEYYGFSLATVDLNGDGYDELLVGAPMYSVRGVPEVGQVYVYRNLGGSLQRFKTLSGESEEYVRFGHAIVNLGDINGDGLEDVAISAPFGKGSGKVFIYYGSRSDFISSNPQQIINGSDVTRNLTVDTPISFGSSLASSIDVDGNGVNDLVIGAYRSQQVFLLRTRVVAPVAITLTAAPLVVDVQADSNTTCRFSHNSMMYPCFNVTVCASYPSNNQLSDTIELTITLFAERQNIERGLDSRVFFDNSEQQPQQMVVSTFSQGQEQCITETVFVKRGIVDIFRGFPIEISVTGPEFTSSNKDGNPDPSNFLNFPVVTTTGTTEIQVETLKDCQGSVCIPNLRLERINVTYETTTGVTTNTLTAGLVSAINIWMRLTNAGDDSFLTQLVFLLDTVHFSFVRIEPRNLLLSCNSEPVGTGTTRFTCPIANPLSSGNQRVIAVRVQPTTSINGSEGNFQFQFNATSINDELPTTLSDNTYTESLTVRAQADVYLDQAITSPEQVSYDNTTNIANLTYVTQLGPQVNVSFVVRNDGPTTVPNTRLLILWPLRPSDSSDLYYLYPFRITVSSTSAVTCANMYINPLGLDQSPINNGDEQLTGGQGKRKRRNLDTTDEGLKLQKRQSSSGGGGGTNVQDITIDCRSDQTQCVQIVCNILQLPQGGSAQIGIVSHLDERYFESRVDRFTFITYANVTIVNSSFITQPTNHLSDETSAQVRAITSAPRTRDGDTKVDVEAWMIIVPIVLALIFFTVLGVILYFVGFFKRKHKQKKDELTAQFLEEQQGGEAPVET